MTILVTFMLIFLSQVACRVRLDYNPKLDSLVAYNGSTGINLKINFQYSGIQIHNSLSLNDLFLSKDRHYPLRSEAIVWVEEIQGLDQDQIQGIIGFKHPSVLEQLLAHQLRSSQVKFLFELGSSGITVLTGPCNRILHPSFAIIIKGQNSLKYSIDTFSLAFSPGIQFLAALGKQSTPFSLSANERLQLNLLDQSRVIDPSELLGCRQYAGSQNSECDIVTTPGKSNVGRLLFYFNPTICGSGIQWQSAVPVHSSKYFWLHLLLALIHFVTMSVYFSQDSIVRLISGSKSPTRSC